jgi:hypothetical protein
MDYYLRYILQKSVSEMLQCIIADQKININESKIESSKLRLALKILK